MQVETQGRRSNKDRSAQMRGKLMSSSRALFVEKGFAETGTPEIVNAAKVTRGALYHHFSDKAELFHAIVVEEAEAVARQIEKGSIEASSPVEALMQGAEAYFSAMSKSGRARLLLVEGPAVLGPERMAEIDLKNSGGILRAGLHQAAEGAGISDKNLAEIAVLLSAAFDRAALEISMGSDVADYSAAIETLISGLFGQLDQG